MTTPQESRHAAYRLLAGGTVGNYNEDLIAASEAVTGLSGLGVNGMEIALLKVLTGSTQLSLGGLQAAYAAQVGVATWSAVDMLPSFALGFDTGRTTLPSSVSFARASVGWYQPTVGLLFETASGAPRLGDRGFLIEGARTNAALHSRDLTNAAWTKTNVTATRDQTGPDGAANSATRLAATSGNGTVTQAITSASAARRGSFYVKRITGTGDIDLTLDNGSTWTTVAVTSEWTRVSKGQTNANPTIGIRVVTSGDEVAVDFVQEEVGSVDSSPIVTGASAVTRAADVATIADVDVEAWYSATAATITSRAQALGNNSGSGIVWQLEKTPANRLLVFKNGGSPTSLSVFGSGGVFITGSLGIIDAPKTTAAAYAANDVAFYGDGAQLGVDATYTIEAFDTVLLGSSNVGGQAFLDGYLQSWMFTNSRLPNATLAGITT